MPKSPLYLDLLRTSALFDLRYKWERKRSAKLLRRLTIGLHAHIGPQVVFEIGACEASFSQAIRTEAPNAQIFAFEASPFNFGRYSSQQALRELDIRYLNRAISDQSGTVEFYMRTRKGEPAGVKYSETASLLQRSRPAEYSVAKVQAWSLADFIVEEKLAGLSSTVWIDVEGAIGKVLTGIGDRIEQFRLIHCEVEDMEMWAKQWTSDQVFAYLDDRNFVPVARDFEFPFQFNVLFLREELLTLPMVRLALAQHYSRAGQSGRWWDVRRYWFGKDYRVNPSKPPPT